MIDKVIRLGANNSRGVHLTYDYSKHWQFAQNVRDYLLSNSIKESTKSLIISYMIANAELRAYIGIEHLHQAETFEAKLDVFYRLAKLHTRSWFEFGMGDHIENMLIGAIRSDDVDSVEELFSFGAAVEITFGDGFGYPLLLAKNRGFKDLEAILIAHGADIEQESLQNAANFERVFGPNGVANEWSRTTYLRKALSALDRGDLAVFKRCAPLSRPATLSELLDTYSYKHDNIHAGCLREMTDMWSLRF